MVGAHDSHRANLPGFLRDGGSTLFPEEVGLLGDLREKTLLHLQCNSGGDSLSLAWLGARVTGVDISDEAIESAQKLARQAGAQVRFERADLYDWLRKASREGRRFDAVFASYGVGFNLIFGSSNQLFLCVGALAGIGGYTTAIVADRASLPIVGAIAVGTVAAAVAGGLLSWIAVRRSLGVIFTGIVTLVFSLAFANVLLGKRDLTGSETGLLVPAAALDLGDDQVGGY